MTTRKEEYMNLIINDYKVQIYQVFEDNSLKDISINVDGEEKDFYFPNENSSLKTNLRYMFIDSKGNFKPLEYLDYFIHWTINMPGEYKKHPFPEKDFHNYMMSSTLEPYQL